MPKTGADHLRSLADGRRVFVGGSEAANVVTHPAFRNAVQTIAGLYDYQCAPENLERMTFEAPGRRRRVNRAWQLPTSYQELVQRREVPG